MYTFLIGLVLLIVGGFFYGQFCQKVFRPDDRRTPALTRTDGVDYLPMKSWKNSLIELLNIAGTGPILGPIQGILFGPIAFLTIPIGCVLGGTSMAGGIGNVVCSIIGVFVVGIINNVMNLCSVNAFWQQVVKGIVILVAVLLDVFTRNAIMKSTKKR